METPSEKIIDDMNIREEKRKYLLDVIEKLKKEEDVKEECIICLEKVTNTCILGCGHIFCLECINEYFNNNMYIKKCPSCREITSKSSMYEIDYNKNIDNDEDEIKNEYGIKIYNIINYIKEKGDKIIILSSFMSILKKISDILTKNNIKFYYYNSESKKDVSKINILLLCTKINTFKINLSTFNKILLVNKMEENTVLKLISKINTLEKGKSKLVKLISFPISETVDV